MDPNDPLAAGESHNGAAAEEEPAHSDHDSSQFETPGTVNSRRGTQTGLPNYIEGAKHILYEFATLALQKGMEVYVTFAVLWQLTAQQVSKPAQVLDKVFLAVPLAPTAGKLDLPGHKNTARLEGAFATMKCRVLCIAVLLVAALGASASLYVTIFAYNSQLNYSMDSGFHKQMSSSVEYSSGSNISFAGGGDIATFQAAGHYYLSSPSIATWHDFENLATFAMAPYPDYAHIEATTGKLPVDKKNLLQELSAQELAKVAALVSASVENYGLNCSVPDAVLRDYNESSPTPSMQSHGANAFVAHSAKGSGMKSDGRPNRFASGGCGSGGGGSSGGEGSGGGGKEGKKRTAEQRAASREISKEHRAKSVASHLKDTENFTKHDESGSSSGGGGCCGGDGGKGGQKFTAEQRAASREKSKERRAKSVASHLSDEENLKKYGEAARATDPLNNFKQLKAGAQKINGEFKVLDKKVYGTKFSLGPFKRKNENGSDDIEVIWPLEMNFGSLYEFARKDRGDLKVKCPTHLYVRTAAIMDAARLGPGGYLSSWGEAFSNAKELSKGTNWEKSTRDYANSLRPGTVPLP